MIVYCLVNVIYLAYTVTVAVTLLKLTWYPPVGLLYQPTKLYVYWSVSALVGISDESPLYIAGSHCNTSLASNTVSQSSSTNVTVSGFSSTHSPWEL